MRSATLFAHTCASVGEFARVLIESEHSRKEGNALKSQIIFSSPENIICETINYKEETCARRENIVSDERENIAAHATTSNIEKTNCN